MEALMQPDKLRTRILLWSEEEINLGALPAKSGNILEVALYREELPRGDAAAAVGATDRHARRIVAALRDQWHGRSISGVSRRIQLVRGMEKPFREEDL
jgi:hypothetical protein